MREVVVFTGGAHPCSGRGHLREPRRTAVPGRDPPVLQRLPAGPAAGQLPAARCLHHAAAGAADAGEPDGAAADDRRRPGCVGGADHGGHPALRVRPVGQEGRLAHLARRPAGRGHARHGGRRPGAHDGAARTAGARVLLGPGRPPDRDRRPRRPFPGHRPVQHRRRLPRPRQRQDRDAVRPPARATRRRRHQAAPRRRPGRHRRDRRRRGRQARHHPRRRDRHRRLHHRTARPAQGPRLHRGRRRVHARPVREERPSSGSSSTR